MNVFLVFQLLLLLMTANGSPLLAKRLLGNKVSHPLDGGMKFPNGKPLLGPAKTIRGVVCSLAATAIVAPLIGLPALIGLVLAASAMAGDVISSFLKRRLGLPPSSMALGLDQVPESLLPLLVVRLFMPLTLSEILAAVLVFLLGELLLSRVLFWLDLRDEPY